MTKTVYCRTLADLHNWLENNGESSAGLWLEFDKGKNRTMSYDDIVDELLCFGWIDSKPGKVNDTRSKLWIAPRSPTSNWSGLNKERIARLARQKRLQPAGAAMVADAKKRGTWNALDMVEALVVPQDLEQELEKYKYAADYFAAFPPSTKRAILEWILTAKKPETRQARIEQTAREADQNIRANQFRQPKK